MTDDVVVTFGGEDRREQTLDLAVGERQTFAYSTTTDEDGEPGEVDLRVTTPNESRQEPVRLVEVNAKVVVANVSEANGPPADDVSGGMGFSALVKNVGNTTTSTWVTLSVPEKGITLARAKTGVLTPGEGDCEAPDSCAERLTTSGGDWVFDQDARGTSTFGEWAPDGEHGWWTYQNEVLVATATTDTWEDEDAEEWQIPQLPAFKIVGISPVEKGAPCSSGVCAHGVSITVENLGDFAGTPVVSANQTATRWEDGNMCANRGCEVDVPVDLGTPTASALDPGETSSWELVTGTNGYQQTKEDLQYKTGVRPDPSEDYWDQGTDWQDTAVVSNSWDESVPPPDGGNSCGLEINQEKAQAPAGEKIFYDVVVIDDDGETEQLSPSEYEIGKTQNSEGNEYQVYPTYVTTSDAGSGGEDGKQVDWYATTTVDGEECVAVAGATFHNRDEDRND